MPFIEWAKKYLSSLKKFTLQFACCLFLAISLAGCSAIGSSKPAALQVTSTPEATVFLDGKHLGKTPFYSDQLTARQYTLKITSGEASYIALINLNEGTLTVINRELNNNFQAQSGEVLSLISGDRGLFVTSTPTAASVSVDGKNIGESPIKVDDISEGEHQVTLALPGYLNHDFAIKTSHNYQLSADVTLASQIAKATPTEPSPSPQVQKVEVLATPQGFLRVRGDASQTAVEIGRVNTGDQLEVIQEALDWFEVKFTDKQGWVSSQYVKKL